MSQRFVFEEDYSWPVTVIRAVMWSATLALLWVIPWIVFVVVGSFYFDFVEARLPVAQREYDGLGIGLIFYGVFYCVIFSFFVGAIVGFVAALEAKQTEGVWPFRSCIIQLSFRWVLGIILVMLLGAAAAFLEVVLPLPF